MANRMATARQLNLEALLKKGMNIRPSSFLGSSGSSGYSSSLPNLGEGVTPATAFYTISFLLFIIFLLLLVVHYTITPIFTFSFGEKGYFSLADTNDGQLVWSKAPENPTTAAVFQRNTAHTFTIQLDLLVDDVAPSARLNRTILYRGSTAVIPVASTLIEDMIGNYPESNLFIYLLPDTNDLVVSCRTVNGLVTQLESTPTILNVPLGKPFRIAVVLYLQLVEVYLNGKLFGTKAFRAPLSLVTGNFYGTPQLYRSSVRSMNLQYWDRTLTAAELANTPPSLPEISLFGLNSASSCVT